MSYTFELSVMKKKKEKEENKFATFTFDFLDCVEKYWNSGAIFDIRMAKGFHL